MKHRICIVTGTRAEWGILSPLARELQRRSDVDLQIVATNMHLQRKFGHTVDNIIADGFNIDACVPMATRSDSEVAKVRAMARCMSGMAEAFERLKPELVVILGDRYEMLAVASAAAMMHIPIVHFHGGEISEGAIDDSIRHSITKLSSLHLTSTAEYRRRVIQMGEAPDRVLNIGSLGVWNILHQPLLSADELRRELNFDFTPGRLIIATFHPATLDFDATPAERCRQMLRALSLIIPEYKIILTYPNNDPGSDGIVEQLRSFADEYPESVKLVKSLGMKKFLSALKYADAMVGNSSSGILEAPSMGVPTVDIGMRQRGRIAAPSVIHCDNADSEIYAALQKALSPEFQEIAKRRKNPYYNPDTLLEAIRAIVNFCDSKPKPKVFYDL